jgi:DNA-binding XRE family transcriptional regulator
MRARLEGEAMSPRYRSAPPYAGPALRTWRKAEGLSQHRLAALLGVARDMVSAWERGQRNTPWATWLGVRFLMGHRAHDDATQAGAPPLAEVG